jgi:pyruvate-ferredoxin/flavodoxin oxidoreductase
VESGYWPLYRFDPRRMAEGQIPFVLESAPPKIDLGKYALNESRYRMVEQAFPERFKELLAAAQKEVTYRYGLYEQLAGKDKK